MELLLFLVLGGAVAYLWHRLDKVETELREWHYYRDPVAGVPAREDSVAGPDAAPARAAEPVPIEASEPPPAETVRPATRAASHATPVGVADEVAKAPPAPLDAQGDEETASYWSQRPGFDFEEIFGRLLPIWLGGVTLAAAGFFLVRWSIEQGLLTPPVRVALSFAFGLALLAGAELAYRFEKRVADPRVRQALAGAGLATLYAGFYLAGSHYGLIGAGTAFVGLAAVTAAAIGLSFRFGLPAAILGLVGGFAAPLLVGGAEANVPLLALYLALVTAGLTFTGRQQHRSWLALAALAGGLGWGVMLLLSGVSDDFDTVALGGYLVLLGVVLPAFTAKTEGPRWMRVGAAAIASLQLAAMVADGGFSLLAWSLYLLIGAALAFFGWREPRMREANAVAAAIGLGLASLWVEPSAGEYALVMGGMVLVFAIVPLAAIWRDRARLADFLQSSGFALLASAVTWHHFALADVEILVALVVFGFALLPALAAWLRWTPRDAALPLPALISLGTAALGLFAAGLIATPDWAAPLVGGAVTAGLLALGSGRADRRPLDFAWASALATLFALFTWNSLDLELYALVQGGAETDYLMSPLRWAAAAGGFAWIALREDIAFGRRVAEATAAASLYALAAQLLPGEALAWFAGLAAVAFGWAWKDRRAGWTTLFAITGLWALPLAAIWLGHGVEALAGTPMLASDTATIGDMALYVLPLVACSVMAILRDGGRQGRLRYAVWAAGGTAALCAVHTTFKQLLAIDTPEAFAALGVVERFVWQALLLATAAAIWRFGRTKPWALPAVAGLTGVALLHFAVFSLGWHNPLWAGQQAGQWPLANWLVPAYATGLTGLLLLRHAARENYAALRPLIDAAIMTVIGLFALSELRHAFAGTLLTAPPVGQVEDLLRSLLGIVLAIGFLLWGSRSGERSWRIGSLVLMLLAVGKVFLLDAAGLEGLARIASFMALGFSLIGIGWFYKRQFAHDMS